MLQNAAKCLLNVSQNASQNASQDASKCFGRFQNAAKGFECLFGIALECFKMLPNKFVFFVNYSDRSILRILLGLTKKQYMGRLYDSLRLKVTSIKMEAIYTSKIWTY